MADIPDKSPEPSPEEIEADQGWKYYLFKKRYPAWIYTIVLAICAVAIYMWIRYLASL